MAGGNHVIFARNREAVKSICRFWPPRWWLGVLVIARLVSAIKKKSTERTKYKNFQFVIIIQ